jgi:Spy/CpxP family protein refolding chaperone
MNRFRCLALGTGLALVVILAGVDPTEGQDRAQKRPIQGVGRGATGPLVSAELQEKLTLSKEQKEKIEKIAKEFAEKSKDVEAKMKEARAKAMQDKDRAALQKVVEAAQKVRSEYEDKVKTVLNDDQKKKFDEGKQAGGRPGVRPGVRPAIRLGDAKPDLASKDVQEKLVLTAEQKEKLETLRKEYEAKSVELLTKKQKEEFEELKKQAPPPRVRRPNTDKQ